MALSTSYDDLALHQRALDALRQRNEQRRAETTAQGQPWNPWYEERPDPNFGMWNDVFQGMEETSTGAKQRLRMSNPALQGLRRVL